MTRGGPEAAKNGRRMASRPRPRDHWIGRSGGEGEKTGEKRSDVLAAAATMRRSEARKKSGRSTGRSAQTRPAGAPKTGIKPADIEAREEINERNREKK